MQNSKKINYVYTHENKCRGCNKCIFKCPTNANKASWVDNRNIVSIKEGFCISCGECISICDHGARDYFDDIKYFFDDLEKGIDISMVVAPAAHVNFDDVSKLIGFLKAKGVNKVYDVSYGADICTWAYLKYIKENNPRTVIAQPCPVVVSHIEKFHTELINYLSPIQSPVMCLGLYLKKYENVTDKFAFLSPCVGKKRECGDANTFDTLQYNVTFAKLLDYIEANNIDLDEFPAAEFDSVEGSIGFAFPRPGGLSENVRLHLGKNVWTKQVEGIDIIEDYFKQLLEDLHSDKPVPLIIDALNCEHGCNLGTGTRKDAGYNYVDYSINERKNKVLKTDAEKLSKHFDEKLALSDFIRKYTDHSADYAGTTNYNLGPVFDSLGKQTEESRNTNCFSCGYGSCIDFVTAVAAGDNHINNCHHFLLDKFVSLSTRDILTGMFNRYSYFELISSYEAAHPSLVGVLFADINKLKETNDLYGHDAGDELIRNAANILSMLFENSIYRIGGDEFVIVETCNDEQSFANKVDELKVLLAKDRSVLISVGYDFSRHGGELNDKINEAEKKMYIDKKEFYQSNDKYDRRRNR